MESETRKGEAESEIDREGMEAEEGQDEVLVALAGVVEGERRREEELGRKRRREKERELMEKVE